MELHCYICSAPVGANQVPVVGVLGTFLIACGQEHWDEMIVLENTFREQAYARQTAVMEKMRKLFPRPGEE